MSVNLYVAKIQAVIRAACRACDGTGIARYIPPRYVTADMASDAENPSLEGSLYSPEIIEECQYCGIHMRAITNEVISSIFSDVIDVLKPFAAMHRPYSDPSELGCIRGTASDRTIIISKDFERANECLKALLTGQ